MTVSPQPDRPPSAPAGDAVVAAHGVTRRFGEGYQLCTILNDVRLMASAAAAAVREARGQVPQAAPKTY